MQVFCCEVDGIFTTLLSDDELLELLFSLLEQVQQKRIFAMLKLRMHALRTKVVTETRCCRCVQQSLLSLASFGAVCFMPHWTARLKPRSTPADRNSKQVLSSLSLCIHA